MKTKNLKILSMILALAIPLVCHAVTTLFDSIDVPVAQRAGAANTTNYTLGTQALTTEFHSFSSYDQSIVCHWRINWELTGTNAAAVNPTNTVRVFIAVSYDGTNFSKPNPNLYVDCVLDSNQVTRGSVPLEGFGIKAVEYGGRIVQSPDNGYTNLTLKLSHTE